MDKSNRKKNPQEESASTADGDEPTAREAVAECCVQQELGTQLSPSIQA